jgi:hypothetical protein
MKEDLMFKRGSRPDLDSRKVLDELAELRRSLSKIETALVVRDPGNARSVEAYDGLRKQVASVAGDRRRLLVVLTEISEAMRRGESADLLLARIQDWSIQTGLAVLHEFSQDHFELVDRDSGQLRVIEPAYVDVESSRTIRRGVATGSPLMMSTGIAGVAKNETGEE